MKKKWMWIIVILYIGFIFSNSLQVGETSGDLSKGITLTILNCLHHIGITIPFNTFHHFIRKLAHFSEYFVLGLLVVFAIAKQPLLQNKTINYLTFWIIPPSLDESIQHFVPGRYGCLTDVFIDMSGFLVATILLTCILKSKHAKKM